MSQPQSTVIAAPDYLRRSPLYRWHVQAGASFEALHDTAIVAAYGDAADEESTAATRLGLADLSPLPRLGFKGAGTADWLAAQGIAVPTASNHSQILGNRAITCRLSPREVLILSDLEASSQVPRTLHQAWRQGTAVNTWLVARGDSHCWFALSGKFAAQTLSKLCAVDLRAGKFETTAIAQTSVARCSAIVIRHDLSASHCFYLLVDLSLAEFLWGVLLDAMLEFGGRAVGIGALRTLAAAA